MQPLHERHADTILRFLQSMTTRGGAHQVDDCVRDCISEIARIEGKPKVAPGYEYLYRWERRGDLPKEYLELARYLKERFRRQDEQLQEEKKKREELVS